MMTYERGLGLNESVRLKPKSTDEVQKKDHIISNPIKVSLIHE